MDLRLPVFTDTMETVATFQVLYSLQESRKSDLESTFTLLVRRLFSSIKWASLDPRNVGLTLDVLVRLTPPLKPLR